MIAPASGWASPLSVFAVAAIRPCRLAPAPRGEVKNSTWENLFVGIDSGKGDVAFSDVTDEGEVVLPV
ncbi:hypothetical protein TUSST3_29170 [Streptomyces sp. TUS-ST3]|nr:hypothetical protein TUSST3_29170 [Streptomyces sp. TUS-ST3]